MKYNKIHVYFWVIAVFVLVFRVIFFNSDAGIDINVHDTYFVIDNLAVTSVLTTLLFIIGFIYFILYRFKVGLSSNITSIHTFVTIAAVLISQFGLLFVSSKDLFFDNEFSLYESINLITAIGFMVQPIFILNILFSTIRHFLKK